MSKRKEKKIILASSSDAEKITNMRWQGFSTVGERDYQGRCGEEVNHLRGKDLKASSRRIH